MIICLFYVNISELILVPLICVDFGFVDVDWLIVEKHQYVDPKQVEKLRTALGHNSQYVFHEDTVTYTNNREIQDTLNRPITVNCCITPFETKREGLTAVEALLYLLRELLRVTFVALYTKF